MGIFEVVVLENGNILLALAIIFGFLMAFGVGANDVANAMGTSVGSRAITIKQAIIIAIIFEFAGAWLAGGEVTSTIRKGIVDVTAFNQHPELLVYGMLASLLSAGLWLVVATSFGWPVSTTHAIVGAIVGFATVSLGVNAVQWSKIGTISLSWITSPLMAGFFGFFLFKTIQKGIFNAENPFANAKKYLPVYAFLVGFLIAMVTLTKGLKHLGLDLSYSFSIILSILIGIGIAALASFLTRFLDISSEHGEFWNVEKTFSLLMIFTACAMAFAHGSNDVANAVGPLAAIADVLHHGYVSDKALMPSWILLLGGIGIVVGLALYGHKVIATVGTDVTELTPSRGFAATLATAATVVFASGTGMPVSTTHTLVGAILGVGMARGLTAINLKVIYKIITSWVITLPIGAFLSIIFFYIIKWIFG